MGKRTEINYDALLKIFLGKDDLRPSQMQANTVENKTYSTDSHSMLIVPTALLSDQYPPYNPIKQMPDFEGVVSKIPACSEIVFKDTDLFKVLELTEKEFDHSLCGTCFGEGECPHCGASCIDCDGGGYREDQSLPLIYTDTTAVINIAGKPFSPRQLGKLEKFILTAEIDTFSVIGQGEWTILLQVGECQLIIAAANPERDILESLQILELRP